MSKQADLSRFLATPELADLGPKSRPGVQSQPALEEQLQRSLNSSEIAPERQELIRALLLLWHDHLDSAHKIAQEIDNPDGAFVHGIMHRREPDFSNAAYWFRRVGQHRAYPQIALEVATLLQGSASGDLLSKLVRGGQWDPYGFIAACEEAARKPEAYRQTLRQVQRLEFGALLESLTTK